tara:strand:- start:1576 stop:1710 length:135 start_codon:yes stop_codon:yes gene_type:complete
MWDDEFIKAVYEIAFGENAIHRGFTYEEVLDRLSQLEGIQDDRG